MKLFISLLLIMACLCSAAQAQEIEIPDTLNGWQNTWDFRLSGSQASYSNWSQGGTSNVAASARTQFTLMTKVSRFSYGFRIDTRYGGARLSEEGLRKTEDRLFINNRFTYDLQEDDSIFKLFSNFTLRTQFDKGFDYGGNEDGSDRLISRFMAPGIFNQNAGLAYVLNNTFTFEAGLGLQQKLIRDKNLSVVYGLDPGDRLHSEAGFTIGSSFESPIATNVELKSSLNTFTNMKHSVLSTDIYFSNTIQGEINSNMNASLNLDLVYDDDFSNRIQIAQVVSLGLIYSI